MGNHESYCTCWTESPELIRTSTSKYARVYPPDVFEDEFPIYPTEGDQTVSPKENNKGLTSTTREASRSEIDNWLKARRAAVLKETLGSAPTNGGAPSSPRIPVMYSMDSSQHAHASSTRGSGGNIPGNSPPMACFHVNPESTGRASLDDYYKSFSSMSSRSTDNRESRVERGTRRSSEHTREGVERDCNQDHAN